MTDVTPTPMNVRSLTPVLNVVSVPASLAWFETLGWTRSFTWNRGGEVEGAADRNEHGPADFGGVCCGEATIFLCQDGQGSRGGPVPRHVTHDDTGGVWMSWWLGGPDEVDACYARALELGYDAPRPPRDEPWGVREFVLRHPDGHSFRVSAGVACEG